MTLLSYKKKTVYRNFPNAKPRILIFDNGINDSDEIKNLIDIINSATGKDHSVAEKERSWYKYSDDEAMAYVFENTNLAPTRFSTGTPPVWYGSESLENSLEEVLFHLKKNVRKDIDSLKLAYKKKHKPFEVEYIENERAMAEAQIESKIMYDGKYLKGVIPNYIDVKSYPECIEEALIAQKSGADGVLYLSARSGGNVNCVAIWNKDVIKESLVKRFYSIIIYTDETREELVIEIPSSGDGDNIGPSEGSLN